MYACTWACLDFAIVYNTIHNFLLSWLPTRKKKKKDSPVCSIRITWTENVPETALTKSLKCLKDSRSFGWCLTSKPDDAYIVAVKSQNIYSEVYYDLRA